MYNFLKYHNVDVTIVATKVDKIGRTLRDKQVKLIKDTLNLTDDDSFILFSSSTKLGKKNIHSIISKIVYNEEE
jgi:GTP-binding protein